MSDEKDHKAQEKRAGSYVVARFRYASLHPELGGDDLTYLGHMGGDVDRCPQFSIHEMAERIRKAGITPELLDEVKGRKPKEPS